MNQTCIVNPDSKKYQMPTPDSNDLGVDSPCIVIWADICVSQVNVRVAYMSLILVSWFGWIMLISRFLQSTEKFIVRRKRSAFTSGERRTVLHNSMLGTLSNPKNIWRVFDADLCTRYVFLKGDGISTPGFGRVSTRRYSPWWPQLVPSQRFQGFKKTPRIAHSLWKPLSLLISQVGDNRRFS